MSAFPVYDAVVNTDEKKGDYTLPSAAFANGALNVFVRRGVYNEESDIVIPVGGTLTGEHRGLTIIDFGGNAGSIRCESGYLAVESAGTIELVSGSAEVEGTDTTFTNLTVGDCIQIHNNDVVIAAIADDTHLTLESAYNGRSGSGITFSALLMRSYDSLKNFTVRNSTATGLNFSGCRRLKLKDVTVRSCTPNLSFTQCGQFVARNVISEYSLGVGSAFNACRSGTCSTVSALSNYSHGATTTGNCTDLMLHDFEGTSNGGNGLYVNGVFSDANVTSCVFRQNYAAGAYTNSAAFSFVVNGCTVDSNGATGIESHGEQAIFTNSTFRNNVTCGLDMSGDYCIAGKNIGFGSATGARISGSRCNFCDNSFTDASSDSCHIMSGADNNIVTGNHFEGGGNNTLYDEGTNTLTAQTNKP